MQISKTRMRRASALLTVCAWLLLSVVGAQAQIRIYNEEKDKQAQEAEKLAETIKNSALFEKQLKNLSLLSRREFEMKFQLAKQFVNSAPGSIFTWGNALDIASGALDLEKPEDCAAASRSSAVQLLPTASNITQASNSLSAQIAAARAKLDELKAAIKEKDREVDPNLEAAFTRLGDFSDLLTLAQKIRGSGTDNTTDAISQITQTIGFLQNIYAGYQQVIDELNRNNELLGDLRITMKKAALQSLQVDEEHWKNVAAIRARRETEIGLVNMLVRQYSARAWRLGLTSFNPATVTAATNPARCNPATTDCGQVARQKFCEAVMQAKADGHLRYGQPLTESVKELSVHVEALEQKNQDVLAKARAALRSLAENTDDEKLAEIAKPLQESINAAATNIKLNDTVHIFEGNFKQSFEQVAGKLSVAVSNKKRDDVIAQARGAIALANQNIIAHRNIWGDFSFVLYDLAALIARGDTPAKLADLRYAQELQAYSIRKSAAEARVYELLVVTGVKRLALYHKGGLKPETVAAFIHALSNVAISPAILAR